MPSSKKPFDPSKPITIGNWPPNLRMPPRRQQQPSKKKKLEKPDAFHEGPVPEVEKPPLWDFSDCTE